jgi:hypothetical protein
LAYRNGTYIAFHANKFKEPGKSDMDYYNLLKAWNVRSDDDFHFTNSHDKAAAVRDTSKRATLEASLKTRLLNSKNMVLIVGRTTKEDTDWVPFEIRYAIDKCEIPIIAAYTGYDYIMAPEKLSDLWPAALATRIRDGSAHVIHIPFRKLPLAAAINQFSYAYYPNGGGLGYYEEAAYRSWGLI